jgi:hypothetical protein
MKVDILKKPSTYIGLASIALVVYGGYKHKPQYAIPFALAVAVAYFNDESDFLSGLLVLVAAVTAPVAYGGGYLASRFLK